MSPAFTRTLVAPSLALVCLASPASAQQHRRYIRLSVASAHLQAPGRQFPLSSALQPTAALGYRVTAGQSVEIGLHYLSTQTTEPFVPAGGQEAPYTIGVRVVTLEASYQYRFPLRAGPVQPIASFGGTWSRVQDSWKSDTPAERSRASTFGVTSSVGLVVALPWRGEAVLQGGYQAVADATDRPARHIGLSGTRLDVGLHLPF